MVICRPCSHKQAHVHINTYCATGASSLSCTKAASTGVVIPHGATSQRVIQIARTPHLKDCAENGSMRWPDFPSLPNLKGPVSSCWPSGGDSDDVSILLFLRETGGLWTGGRARASFSWVCPWPLHWTLVTPWCGSEWLRCLFWSFFLLTCFYFIVVSALSFGCAMESSSLECSDERQFCQDPSFSLHLDSLLSTSSQAHS